VKLTPGKMSGLKAVSNDRGVIAAAAMDQRGSLKKALGPKASEQDLIDFKIAVSEVLTRYASAILLDPEWGLPAAKARQPKAGLLLAYEKTGYDKQTPGRLPDLLDLWSVRRLKAAGADCIKILLYYAPADPKHINELKHAWTERIGDECVANDIPFFLEIIGYEEGMDEKSLAYAKKKPEIVQAYMREFTKPQYNVDVLKLEVPINMKFVEGTASFKGEKAYTKAEAMECFRKSAEATNKPYIYLSAGVSNAEFSETLELVGESGVKYNGVLCGRATWADGMPIFAEKGLAAFREWLEVEGVENIQKVNAGLKAASPWWPIYGL
jgi:tagatose 1,6-diphosphate aldolase